MSLKTLPKSLIAAAAEVFDQDAQRADNLTRTLAKESLSFFNVSDVSTLTESDIKAMHSWVTKEFERRMALTEAECTCGATMAEDDKADADHDGDCEIESGSAEYLGAKDKAIKAAMKNEDDSEEVSENDKIDLDEEESEKNLKENVALSADDIATNGAVGVGDASIATPKHADVIKDSSPLDGTSQYRMLVQFATNTGTQIVPSASLPGAPTVEALREIVEGLPYFNDVMDAALTNAA